MVRMNFIFISISSSDTNLLRKKSVKQKIKNDGLIKVLQFDPQANQVSFRFGLEIFIQPFSHIDPRPMTKDGH